MMRAFAVIALFVVVALAGNSIPPDVVTFPTTIQAMNITGLEVVLLDGPSWATHIQRSHQEHEYYVFGDKTLRTIHSGPSISDFYAQPDTDPLVHPLLDLHTFYYVDSSSNLNKITIGVSDFLAEDSNRYNNIAGAYLPLYSAILNLNSTATTSTQTLQENAGNNGNPALNGFMMYAVRCDEANLLAYFAGFKIDPTNGGLSFVLLRTAVNLGNGGGLKRQTFSFNATNDVFTLYTNQFTTFNEAFKPWVHVLKSNNGHNIAVVVDPNTKAIYSVDLETGFQSTRTLLEINTNSFTTVYDVVSSSYDYNTEQLVVGLSATGNAGVIRLFNLPAGATTINANYSIPAYTTINLPSGNYTNPKALAVDDTDLYIGVNGANVILKYNFANQQFTYQTLPEFMHRTWDAVAAITHVYFVTYEQHSKVFRVNKTDFCPTACPYFGYCVSGKCTCYDGFELSKDKTQCVLIAAEKEIIYKKEIKKVKGGEAALGVFFALAVVAAAAGWFMWWRNRRGAYQAV